MCTLVGRRCRTRNEMSLVASEYMMLMFGTWRDEPQVCLAEDEGLSHLCRGYQ